VSKPDFFDKCLGRDFGYGERAIVEEGGLNPASDLMGSQQSVNKVRKTLAHIDIDV